MLLLVAYLAYAVDLTRTFLTVQQIDFAAESAATDAFANLLNQNGTVPGDRGLANCQNRVSTTHGGSPWNSAPSGPTQIQGNYVSGVTIDASDVVYASNPSDAGEPMLQVTARRSGNDALRFFFMPAIWSMSALTGGGAAPAEASTAPSYRTVEVMGAPATRIGKGASHFATTSSPLAGWAVLPLVISNNQFQSLATGGNSGTEYRIQLLDQTKPYQADPTMIRGAFANVIRDAGAAANPYYGPAGAGGMNDLVGAWWYFAASADSRELQPAAVERNSSMLKVFNCGDPSFTADKTRVLQAIQNASTNRVYIVPVVSSDPTPGASLQVIGFALLNFTRFYNTTTSDFDLRCKLSESLPARNATASMLRAIPTVDGTSLPAPQSVFVNRTYDSANQSFSARRLGVCMAPVVSPRSM